MEETYEGAQQKLRTQKPEISKACWKNSHISDLAVYVTDRLLHNHTDSHCYACL